MKIYQQLKANNQIILKYVNNPNGSYDDIAGIVNEKGNVCGMMPHPEKTLETLLGTDSGVKLFEAMVKSWRGTTCLNLSNQALKKLNLKKGISRYGIK